MWEIIGGVAAALAIVQGLMLGSRWIGRQRLRQQLRVYLGRFFRLDRRLTALVADITWKLADGVGWFGFAVWPDPIKGHLAQLHGLTTELEHYIASVRGLDADASLERLRSDVEEIGERLREMFAVYFQGTMGAYQRSQGMGVPISATGRGPVASVAAEDLDRLMEQRRRIRILFRSAAFRLKKEDWQDRQTGQWAVLEQELPAETDDLWEGQPRPIG